MAADNNHDTKTGLIPILLLLMLATGTLINPLTSSRPHDPQYTKLLSSDVRKVDARLWQDPIAAVERQINQDKESKEKPLDKSIDEFRKEIEGEIQNDTDLRIIAISVFGSSYPELIEFRQR